MIFFVLMYCSIVFFGAYPLLFLMNIERIILAVKYDELLLVFIW